jgi:hypothetical protein
MRESTAVAAMVGVITMVVIALLSPFLMIWALNALFPALDIPYTLSTYFASMVINGMLGNIPKLNYNKD